MPFDYVLCEVSDSIKVLHVSIHIFGTMFFTPDLGEKPSNLEIQDLILQLMFFNHCIFPNHLNPFVPNAPFLYPLKISENRKVF